MADRAISREVTAVTRTRTALPELVPAYGVYVLESHHDVGFRMEQRVHAFVKLIYVLAGAGRVVTASRSIACETGDVIVVPIGQKHHIEDAPRQPMSIYVLCVEPRLWRHDPDLEALLPAGRLPRHPTVSQQVRGQLRRILYEQSAAREAHGTMIVGMTLRLLALLARVGTRRDRQRSGIAETADGPGALRRRVEAYIEELDRRFFEATCIDAAATATGMSRRRFTQLFRQLTGSTWLGYVHRRRIEHARHLLATTPRTVTSIAFECGFEDLSSFYRAFHRHAGQSPTAWRHRVANRPGRVKA